MAEANLLKKPLDWDSVAADIEVNPDGSGFRLTRLTDFFDFTTDEGITWEDNGTGELWGNNVGSLRSANNAIELIGANQNQQTRAYKPGFNIPGDFMLDFNYVARASGGGAFQVGVQDNPKFAQAMIGDGTSNALHVEFFSTSSHAADTFKNGVRSSSGTDSGPSNTTIYGRLKRAGSTLTWETFSLASRLVGDRLTIRTVNNVSTATMTHVIFVSAFLSAGSSTRSHQFTNFELWNGVTQRYSSTSPVVTMGVVALPVGMVINGLGDLVEKLDGSAGISPAYNINNAGWSAPFASYAAMEVFLNANPITITDGVNSVNVRHSHDSNGDEQAEVFISEGPNLTIVPVACDFPAADDVRDGVFYDSGNLEGNLELPIAADVRSGIGYGSNGNELEGTLEATTITLPLEVIEIETLEVIKL